MVPKLWKNGFAFDLPTTIPDPTFSAHSVFKFNDDVYVSGAPGGLWVNGIITPLPENGFCITHSVFVTPSDMPPTITTESLPDGTAGAPYSATLEADSYTPITWSIESGSLPAGFSLDAATGVIDGSPSEVGIFDFTIYASNTAGGSASKELSITVEFGVGIGELHVTSYELRVYPNPTTGELTIDKGELTIDNVEIYDIYGRKLIVNFQLSIFNSIDISDLPAGVYFVKIDTEAGEVMKKVVKK
jgi:hypothetical protein